MKNNIKLTKIQIKNFKCLEDFEIDVKHINFIFGANSSGKSTFLKAMQFLFKNVYPPQFEKTIYKLSEEVDLESFREIVTNNEIDRNIEFDLHLSCEFSFPYKEIFYENIKEHKEYSKYKDETEELLNGNLFEEVKNIVENENIDITYVDCQHIFALFEHTKTDFIISVVFKNSNKQENLSDLSEIKITDDSDYKTSIKFIPLNEDCNIKTEHKPESINYKIPIELLNRSIYNELPTGRISMTPEIQVFEKYRFEKHRINFIPFNVFKKQVEDEMTKKSVNKDFAVADSEVVYDKEIAADIYYCLSKFVFLVYNYLPDVVDSFFKIIYSGSIRELPKTKYLLKDNNIQGSLYGDLLDELFVSQDSLFKIKNIQNVKYSFIKKQLNSKEKSHSDFISSDNSEFYRVINNYINLLGFDKYVIINKNQDIASIFFVNPKNQIVNLANECSGLIQIFPVLLKIASQRNELLFIEQPELHLHPKLQANFAKVIGYMNNIFVETHSEHMIRKMQVMIVNDFMNEHYKRAGLKTREFNYSDIIAINYFSNINGKVQNVLMEIDENGLFKQKWPDGFFDESMDLTFELTKALIKKGV